MVLRRDAMTSSRIAPARSSCPEFARHWAWPSRHVGGVGVVGAELRLRERQRLLEELQRPVVLAGVGVAAGEVAHARERVGVVGPELRLLQRQRLLAELERPVMLAGVGIAVGEVVHAHERVGVVGPELRLLQRQRLLAELQRPVDLAGGGIADGEVAHAHERVGVVGSELRLLSASVSSRSFIARSFWPASA